MYNSLIYITLIRILHQAPQLHLYEFVLPNIKFWIHQFF